MTYSELMSTLTNDMWEARHSVGGLGMAMARAVRHSFLDGLETAAGADGVRFAVAHELGPQVGGIGVEGHEGEYMADAYGALPQEPRPLR